MAPNNGTTSAPPKLVVTPSTMAPCNGTTSNHSKLAVTFPSLHHSTLQWHPAMTPSNGTTSTSPKLVAPCPPTIAHYSGTLRWHTAVAPWCRVHSPKVSRYSPPPTLALYNGTLRWHVHCTLQCTLVPRPIRQSSSSPSPLLEVYKNPYSYHYLGKKQIKKQIPNCNFWEFRTCSLSRRTHPGTAF